MALPGDAVRIRLRGCRNARGRERERMVCWLDGSSAVIFSHSRLMSARLEPRTSHPANTGVKVRTWFSVAAELIADWRRDEARGWPLAAGAVHDHLPAWVSWLLSSSTPVLSAYGALSAKKRRGRGK